MNKVENKLDKALVARFNRLRGQLDGLQRMLAEERDCIEILTQISAIKAALGQLGNHIVQSETNCLQLKSKDKKKLDLIINRFIKTN
ncbi:MAG: metal-sensitive transcriptional regulator [Candidatus Komeilibacteria bacterium]